MRKVEQHIRNKTYKPNALRFWVEGGVITLCVWPYSHSCLSKCKSKSHIEWKWESWATYKKEDPQTQCLKILGWKWCHSSFNFIYDLTIDDSWSIEASFFYISIFPLFLVTFFSFWCSMNVIRFFTNFRFLVCFPIVYGFFYGFYSISVYTDWFLNFKFEICNHEPIGHGLHTLRNYTWLSL